MGGRWEWEREEKERDERMKRQTEERRRFKCFVIVRAITTL